MLPKNDVMVDMVVCDRKLPEGKAVGCVQAISGYGSAPHTHELLFDLWKSTVVDMKPWITRQNSKFDNKKNFRSFQINLLVFAKPFPHDTLSHGWRVRDSSS